MPARTANTLCPDTAVYGDILRIHRPEPSPQAGWREILCWRQVVMRCAFSCSRPLPRQRCDCYLNLQDISVFALLSLVRQEVWVALELFPALSSWFTVTASRWVARVHSHSSRPYSRAPATPDLPTASARATQHPRIPKHRNEKNDRCAGHFELPLS